MPTYRVINCARGLGTHVLPNVRPLGLSPGPVLHAALLPGSEKFHAEQPRLPRVLTPRKMPTALILPKHRLSPLPAHRTQNAGAEASDCACAHAASRRAAPPRSRQTSRYLIRPRRFVVLTALQTWKVLNPCTLPWSRPLRKGDFLFHAMPIIHFFPQATSQQATEWLILGVNVAEGRRR